MKQSKMKKLYRMDFESYIHKCFIKYLEENKEPKKKEFEMQEGSNIIWFTAPNRNPEQVPNGIWNRLLSRHLNKHNYN